jgi:Cytidylyltransferase-like
MTRVGIYPGSFNPPTTAHLSIAEAARRQFRLDRVVLAHSPSGLGKAKGERPVFRDRAAVLEAVAAEQAGLEAAVTRHRLLVDIAAGYDVLIMGADKWHQIQELQWYDGSIEARDTAIAGLPELAIAARPPLEVPAALRLDLAAEVVADVSSTAARGGRIELMAPAARRFAQETGAWIDPDRYERWLLAHPVAE